MATAGKINGHDLLVYVTTTAIGHSTSCSVTLNSGTVATTSKGSFKWQDILPGCRDWTVETSGMITLDTTIGIEELWGYINGKTKLTLKFATSDAADRFFTGYAYLTSVSAEAPDESPSTFTATFQGTAKLKFAKT
ncbi:MAG: phage tail protein [Bacteroidales bacterium]|nr:phage tail protein [Bacteroidales bacterium]